MNASDPRRCSNTSSDVTRVLRCTPSPWQIVETAKKSWDLYKVVPQGLGYLGFSLQWKRFINTYMWVLNQLITGGHHLVYFLWNVENEGFLHVIKRVCILNCKYDKVALQIPNAHHLPLSLLLTLLTEICSVCVHFRRSNSLWILNANDAERHAQHVRQLSVPST